MRKLAILLAAPVLIVSALRSAEVKPGSIISRWPIKTSVKAGADLSKPAPLLPLADFLTLAPAAAGMSKQFETTLFPKTPGSKFADGDIVRTTGYIRLVAGEPDGDYHIQISVTPDTFDNCLVVEVPFNNPDFVTNKTVSDAAATVRDFVMTSLKTGVPTGRIVPISRATYVEVTGQLFFDAEHQAALAKGIYRGKSINGTQLPSKTSWEIHPILKMAFATAPK